ncbi:MAG: DUF4350 domain-containing protein [Theionarchaea archaeon]|nr:DUF4350 domain-containing protein [Theionarchaea archaeon]
MKYQGLLTILLLTGVIIGLIFLGETYTPEPSTHSSTSAQPEGTLAYYLLLETYTAVERLDAPPRNLESGTLVMVEPIRIPTAEEMEYLLQWVEKGNRFLIFSHNQHLLNYFQMPLSSGPQKSVILRPHAVHWSSHQVDALSLTYTHYFNTHPSSGIVLFSDEGHPLIYEIHYGAGAVFLMSTSSLVQNKTIDSADNEIFLTQLALSEKVYFDEYHLYIVKEEKDVVWSTLPMLFSSSYSLAFIQIGVTIGLFFIAYGKRFGTPRPPPPRKVQSSELVESAATLYLRAGKKHILQIIDRKEEPTTIHNSR